MCDTLDMIVPSFLILCFFLYDVRWNDLLSSFLSLLAHLGSRKNSSFLSLMPMGVPFIIPCAHRVHAKGPNDADRTLLV